MMCKQCGSHTFVVDSRPGPPDENTTRRRRKCPACGFRVTTYEVERAAYDNTALVAKLREVAVSALEQIAATVPPPPAPPPTPEPQPEPRSDTCV